MNNSLLNKLAAAALAVTLATSCGASIADSGDNNAKAQAVTTALPQCSGDSAMALVVKQCDMGPRVPGTEAHARCATWLKDRLASLADTVIEQQAPVTTFDGTRLTARNIIAAFNPQAAQRILLLSHYDCRPWADHDPDAARRRDPVMGANDGASGTAVLLELARVMRDKKPSIGIDILLVDVEDWGDSDSDAPDSWALGTQYWAEHPHVAGYKPMMAILLDMVGAKGATFMREQFSDYYAGDIVNLVWRKAQAAGAGNLFVNSVGGAVNDDHVPLLQAGIPAIDIIDLRPGSDHGFFPHWHTTADTPDKLDPATLQAVGNTLLAVIYNQ